MIIEVALKVDGVNDDMQHKLRMFFNDAFGEFIDAREAPTVEDYVTRRYDWMSEKQRESKVREVKERIELARALKRADILVRRV